MSIFFTSDTHFHHKNILKFENRPYSSVEEMNEGIIKSWNNIVKNNDIVYHLGDFCLGTIDDTINILKRLNGKIILIKGNHDFSKHYKKINKMNMLHDYYELGLKLKYKNQEMWLTHFPMEIGLRPRKWSIHGHIHSRPSTYLNQINVGVDSKDFNKKFGEPIEIDELYSVMISREQEILERFNNNKR